MKNSIFPKLFIYDAHEPRLGGIILDEETVEFNVAHNRKYSTEHLWYQEKDDRLMIGVSEFLKLEIGEVLRIILPQAETEVDEGDGMFSIWTSEEKKPFAAPFSGHSKMFVQSRYYRFQFRVTVISYIDKFCWHA